MLPRIDMSSRVQAQRSFVGTTMRRGDDKIVGRPIGASRHVVIGGWALVTATALLALSCLDTQAGEAPLTKKGGVYTVPVRINGAITLGFVVDSGAAEVNVPADVALTLIRAGTIADTDFLPGATYVLADGTEVQSPRFILRSVQIGDHVLRNVSASVGELTSHLLLGQSVLERLGPWSMDTRRGVLAFADDGGTQPQRPGASATAPSESAARLAPDTAPDVPLQASPDPLDPEDTIRRFYALIGAKQYWNAWTMLGADYRAALRNDFSGWVAGYQTTRSVAVTSASTTTATSDAATVEFSLQSTDELASGAELTKTFHGTWALTRIEARWALTKPSIRERKADEPRPE
ncbi:MAG TPA: retropepsin-like aspartic protease [Candidatus Binatia bacterium]|jgi:hypothetical protein|nr:retropepsin-like aspartic protease [Candidatus Binatia bacterium]